MKRNLIYTLFLAFLTSLPLFAIQAKKDVVKEIEQPDGSTILVKQVGDEHFHYYTTVDGIPLLPDSKGILNKVSMSEIQALQDERLDAKFARKSIKNVNYAPAKVSASSWKEVGLYNTHSPHIGDQNALIILVEYADVPFKVENPKDFFNRFLNEEGFSDYGAIGSVRDYFIYSSMNQYRPTFDVYGPVLLGKREEYGANDRYGDDKNAQGMVVEACTLLDDEIDFSKYDSDNDGYVDNVYIIFAGQGENSYGPSTAIWPHQWELKDSNSEITLDGVTINTYGCCNEWQKLTPEGIGTFTHEFCHVLGLPDLYSYSSRSADTRVTPGDWDVMDSGSYNNQGRTPPSFSAFSRNAMGWIDLTELKPSMDVELSDIQESNEACVLPTEQPDEFFLFENRQQNHWDTYLPYHGMLVWHIKFDYQIWMDNSLNYSESRQHVDIEEANGVANSTNPNILKGYSFPGTSHNTEISDITTPNLLSWNKIPRGLAISNIAETDDGIITFSVNSTSSVTDVEIYDAADRGDLFNIQGIKVEGTPAPGLYILRSADSARKVIIR